MISSLSKELLTFCVMFADLKCCSHLQPFSEQTWYLQVKIPSNSEFLLALGTIFPKVHIKKMGNSQPQTMIQWPRNTCVSLEPRRRCLGNKASSVLRILPWTLEGSEKQNKRNRIQGSYYEGLSTMSLIYDTMMPDNCKTSLWEQQRRPPKYLKTSNPSISSSCMASASIPAMNCRANTAKMIKMILGDQEGNMELEVVGWARHDRHTHRRSVFKANQPQT